MDTYRAIDVLVELEPGPYCAEGIAEKANRHALGIRVGFPQTDLEIMELADLRRPKLLLR